MLVTLTSFSSLFLATLLILSGTGLFNTYMGVSLTAKPVSEVWVGALIATYYLGLVRGARLGHKLLIRVGHIRAFVACAALATSMILFKHWSAPWRSGWYFALSAVLPW